MGMHNYCDLTENERIDNTAWDILHRTNVYSGAYRCPKCGRYGLEKNSVWYNCIFRDCSFSYDFTDEIDSLMAKILNVSKEQLYTLQHWLRR